MNVAVITLMKRFSLAWFFLLVAVTALGLALISSQRENALLRTEIGELNEALDSSHIKVYWRDKDLAHSRLGISLLYRMALSGDYADLFAFLGKIPPESLSCTIMELPEYPSIRLFSYYQNRNRPDGSWLPMNQCKSAEIIVKTDSLDIVDVVMHQGFGGVMNSADHPYVTDWDLPDGTKVEYKILPTGFEPVR